MKTTLSTIFLLILAGSCSTNEKEKSATRNAPTTKVTKSAEPEIKQQLEMDVNYVGFIEDFYFTDNMEVYIPLYFQDDEITPEFYDSTVRFGDSLIYRDDENSRTRLQTKGATERLDLRGLDSISIYELNGQLFETMKLSSIEYLEQNISPSFIAVYEHTKKLKSLNHYFCIGNYDQILNSNSFVEIKDQNLAQRLISEHNLKQEYVREDLKSIQLKKNVSDITISTLNSNEEALIIISKSGENQVAYRSSESENILTIVALPIICNELPLLLTESFKPETDMFWNSLLVFNGSNYEIQKRQKINLKNSCQQNLRKHGEKRTESKLRTS